MVQSYGLASGRSEVYVDTDVYPGSWFVTCGRHITVSDTGHGNIIVFCTAWRLTVVVFGFTNATHAALMTSQANPFNCTFPALHLVPDVVDGLVLIAVV